MLSNGRNEKYLNYLNHKVTKSQRNTKCKKKKLVIFVFLWVLVALWPIKSALISDSGLHRE